MENICNTCSAREYCGTVVSEMRLAKSGQCKLHNLSNKNKK